MKNLTKFENISVDEYRECSRYYLDYYTNLLSEVEKMKMNNDYNTAFDIVIKTIRQENEHFLEIIQKHFFVLQVGKIFHHLWREKYPFMFLEEIYNYEIKHHENIKMAMVEEEIVSMRMNRDDAIHFVNKIRFPAFINLSDLYTYTKQFDKAIEVIDMAISKEYYKDYLMDIKKNIEIKKSKFENKRAGQ